MPRARRENTTADRIQVGDVIEPNDNGYRAEVNWISTSDRCAEANVMLNWIYPDDFSVNASHRGKSGGRICRPGDRITRWNRG